MSEIVRWSLKSLAENFAGTTPRMWKEQLAPMCVGAGALHKIGRGWMGRRSDVEAVLLGDKPARRRAA